MLTKYQKIIIVSGVLITLASVAILTLNSSRTDASAISIESKTDLLNFDTTQALQTYFDEQQYHWPVTSHELIPEDALETLPRDLKAINDVKLRKSLFIRIMLPIIRAEQERIREMRSTIEAKLNRTGNDAVDHQWYQDLLDEYNVKADNFNEQRAELLKRIDELPTALVLAQAAIESGWGTSRFAIEGNSLFGQWTFSKTSGLVPEGREDGKKHRVKAFETLQDSVRSYMKNINRNRAYRELRAKRTSMREANKPLDPYKLAEGLHRYSEKGQAYVKALHRIMNSKEFKVVQSLELQQS